MSTRRAALLVLAAGALVSVAAVRDPQPAATGAQPPRPELVRRCSSPIVLVKPSARLRRQSVRAGRVWLYGGRMYARQAAARFAPVDAAGRYRPQRLLVWTGGRDVTLAVPAAARDRFGLLYAQRLLWPGRRVDGYRIADLHHVVEFEGCDHPVGAYEGAVVPAGAGCVPLDVWIDGARAPIRRMLSFGAGHCASAATPIEVRPASPAPDESVSLRFRPPYPIDNKLDLYEYIATGPGGDDCSKRIRYEAGVTWDPRFNNRYRRKRTVLGLAPQRAPRPVPRAPAAEWCPGEYAGRVVFLDFPRRIRRGREDAGACTRRAVYQHRCVGKRRFVGRFAFAVRSRDATGGAGDRVVRTCASQSEASFPGAYRDPRNLVVGPLAWLGARRGGDGAYLDRYRWKHPVVVRAGRTVTLRIVGRARAAVGLAYSGGGWSFAQTARTVVFKSCAAPRADSRADGERVTFWSGGIVATRPVACVALDVRVDRQRLRRRVVPLVSESC